MKVKMTYKKSTKNTYVFEASNSAVPTLYIQKTAFESPPKSILVTIEVQERNNDIESWIDYEAEW